MRLSFNYFTALALASVYAQEVIVGLNVKSSPLNPKDEIYLSIVAAQRAPATSRHAVTQTLAGIQKPTATIKATTTSTTTSAAPSSTVTQLQGYFTGANSYYLHTYADADRLAVLDALQAAGMSTLRIFITYIYANNKGSNNAMMPDLEPSQVGTYDDTVLEAVDQLMLECSERNIRLVIAMHDRYALGFWSTDAYAIKYKIASGGMPGSAQMISDAGNFYWNDDATADFDNRLMHILNHKNAKMGNRKWVDIPEAVYALEAQNEPYGHYSTPDADWMCARAKLIASQIPTGSPIQVSTGGGITTSISLMSWATSCQYHQIISVHDYGQNAANTVSAIQSAIKSNPDRTIMLGEWGATGNNKASTVSTFVTSFLEAGIPMMYWEVTKPGKGANDFEVWTDEDSWQSLLKGKGVNKSSKRSLSANERRTIRFEEPTRFQKIRRDSKLAA